MPTATRPYAAQFNSAELPQLPGHLLEVLAPEIAETSGAERLEREYELAVHNRQFDFRHDGHGTTHLSGALPTVDAEALIQLVGSHAAQQKRALEAIDPLQPMPTRSQRQADGLMAIVRQHAQQALAPSHGGDRPRVVVKLNYDKLKESCVDARLVSAGESISASALRQLACDADLLPAVLNGPSQPLDVGRAQHLVTGPIRAALELRAQRLPGVPHQSVVDGRRYRPEELGSSASAPPQHRRTRPSRRRPALGDRTAPRWHPEGAATGLGR